MATVGENFKALREAKGITQEAIAERLGYKRAANVSLLEKRRNIPKPNRIKKMATVLGRHTWELLDGVPFPHDELRKRPDADQLIRQLREERKGRKTR